MQDIMILTCITLLFLNIDQPLHASNHKPYRTMARLSVVLRSLGTIAALIIFISSAHTQTILYPALLMATTFLVSATLKHQHNKTIDWCTMMSRIDDRALSQKLRITTLLNLLSNITTLAVILMA